MAAYLIVNFGGPRSLLEIEPFLSALLTDRDVVRTNLPQVFNNYLFRRIAKKRAVKVAADYASIGGGSPIYADTEYVAEELRKRLARTSHHLSDNSHTLSPHLGQTVFPKNEELNAHVLTFHRYLPSTHADALAALEACEAEEIRVFPMFPQFTYATTGSIARLFQDRLSETTLKKLKWVKSYPSHPAFIEVTQQTIRAFLEEKELREEETLFFFSAHGIPQSFIDQGDLYAYECRLSYQSVMRDFPCTESLLAFQSKFGPGEWLRPYTQEVCEQIESYRKGRREILFIPISFTSDHIETLFEIEQEYLPIIREQGLRPHRLPALNRRPEWIEAIAAILGNYTPTSTSMLIRH